MVLGQHGALMVLLGGIAFFMFGLSLASKYLQKLSANQVREIFNKLSNKNFLAILLGIGLTILMQSSGAVTSMLVSLGHASIIKLNQVMGVIIGTAIGTTFTVQLISFNVAPWGLPIFAISFSIFFVTHKKPLRYLSGVMMGFGLIFWGIEMMGLGTEVLKEHAWVQEIFLKLNANPLIALLVTAAFTAFVHSSAVTIGLAMSLAASGVLDFYNAMFWVYGANLGTTSTAILASMGGNYVGRQIAWGHFFYKVGSIVLFYFLTGAFVTFVAGWTDGSVRQIANAHTVFNILSALAFFPLINWGAQFIEKIIRPSDKEKEFKVKFLGQDHYENFTVAFSQAHREVLRMAELVQSMVSDSINLFKGEDLELQQSISKRDNQVDLLHREIKLFLVNLPHEDEIGSDTLKLIDMTSDLESAADVVDKSIRGLAEKKQNLKLSFSEEGWKEIKMLHNSVIEIFTLSISSFLVQDNDVAARVIDKKRELRKLEKKFRDSHIERLNLGLKESINTSSIHLDVLAEYRRIAGLISNHVYGLASKEGL